MRSSPRESRSEAAHRSCAAVRAYLSQIASLNSYIKPPTSHRNADEFAFERGAMLRLKEVAHNYSSYKKLPRGRPARHARLQTDIAD